MKKENFFRELNRRNILRWSKKLNERKTKKNSSWVQNENSFPEMKTMPKSRIFFERFTRSSKIKKGTRFVCTKQRQRQRDQSTPFWHSLSQSFLVWMQKKTTCMVKIKQQIHYTHSRTYFRDMMPHVDTLSKRTLALFSKKKKAHEPSYRKNSTTTRSVCKCYCCRCSKAKFFYAVQKTDEPHDTDSFVSGFGSVHRTTGGIHFSCALPSFNDCKNNTQQNY